MLLNFQKYQGAGNDFIIVDKPAKALTISQIARLCDRRFGIGADGFIEVLPHADYDFEMHFYNSDGRPTSMCGNGGRCVALYARNCGLAGASMRFLAADGEHRAEVVADNVVRLSMCDVTTVTKFADGYFLNTGSPHFVQFVDDLDALDVVAQGRKAAGDERFLPQRTNVDFVETCNGRIRIATYERGVEDETLACGTGCVAAAVVLVETQLVTALPIDVEAKGGTLRVDFRRDGIYRDITLTGPAVPVFHGSIPIY